MDTSESECEIECLGRNGALDGDQYSEFCLGFDFDYSTSPWGQTRCWLLLGQFLEMEETTYDKVTHYTKRTCSQQQ